MRILKEFLTELPKKTNCRICKKTVHIHDEEFFRLIVAKSTIDKCRCQIFKNKSKKLIVTQSAPYNATKYVTLHKTFKKKPKNCIICNKCSAYDNLNIISSYDSDNVMDFITEKIESIEKNIL